MGVVYKDNSQLEKLSGSHRLAIQKAMEKLSNMLAYSGKDFNRINGNNPMIHDSYGNGFYLYKYITKNFSVRILYRCNFEKNEVEIHQIHLKKGDIDNSKYIEEFKKYVDNY